MEKKKKIRIKSPGKSTAAKLVFSSAQANTKKPTPGEIMADLITKGGKYTSDDFNKSTKDFFNSRGASVTILSVKDSKSAE